MLNTAEVFAPQKMTIKATRATRTILASNGTKGVARAQGGGEGTVPPRNPRVPKST